VSRPPLHILPLFLSVDYCPKVAFSPSAADSGVVFHQIWNQMCLPIGMFCRLLCTAMRGVGALTFNLLASPTRVLPSSHGCWAWTF
jgi:hypothetical protein